MEQNLVTELKNIKRSMAHLVVLIEPENEDEWNAYEKIVAAHKQLRSIEFSKLGQLPLPLPSDPETECPTCSGRGTVLDGTDAPAMCPRCGGIGKVKASTLQSVLPIEETPETAQAFEALESANPDAWREGQLCATCANACPDPTCRPEHTLNDADKVSTCAGFTEKKEPEKKPRRRRPRAAAPA